MLIVVDIKAAKCAICETAQEVALFCWGRDIVNIRVMESGFQPTQAEDSALQDEIKREFGGS